MFSSALVLGLCLFTTSLVDAMISLFYESRFKERLLVQEICVTFWSRTSVKRNPQHGGAVTMKPMCGAWIVSIKEVYLPALISAMVYF